MLVVMDWRLRPGGGLEAPFTWLTSLLFCPCLVVNFNNRAKVKKRPNAFVNLLDSVHGDMWLLESILLRHISLNAVRIKTQLLHVQATFCQQLYEYHSDYYHQQRRDLQA